MKKCSFCKISKKLENFSKFVYSKDGRKSYCKECRSQSYRENKEKELKRQKEYYVKNKEIINKKTLERVNNNLNSKLKHRLRGRLLMAIMGDYKSGSAVKDLGCSIQELRIWLEQQFHLGMTWENYGRDGWHIDHIIPLSKFDLTYRKQFLEACHYTNLQPLWAKENLSKGNNLFLG